MKHEERDLERMCIDYARQHGWDCWKNENNGNTGIPDHSLLKGGRFVMVEFKASATARIRQEQIRWKERHPETIYFVHNFEQFLEIMENAK